MNNSQSELALSEAKSSLKELERTLAFDEFLDASEKSMKFLEYFKENYHGYEWGYAFIITTKPPPRLLTYQPLDKIEEILEFNSLIDIQAIVKKGLGSDVHFDFDKTENKVSIRKKNNSEYFFFPIFHDSKVDHIDYCREETPTAGFIFHNSSGFHKEQFFEYETFQTLVLISNILYKEILLESITPSSVVFLKERIRKLEEMDAPSKIIQDSLLKALYVGRTQWNWDIIGSVLLQIFDKKNKRFDNDERFFRKLKEFINDLLKDLTIAQNFAKDYIEACKKNNNHNIPAEKLLEDSFEHSKDHNLKFLHHTRNFLKNYRVEFLNLLQVGAVTPQQVISKSNEKKCLEKETNTLVEMIHQTNKILFELN